MTPSSPASPAGTPPTATSSALARWLPPFAVGLFALGIVGIVAVAGSTFGYDYSAYAAAAQRLLDGRPLYDPDVSVAGGFAIYLYPPPFAIAMLPFALLPGGVGPWAWFAVLVAAFVAGVALLPVRREVRWAILLLAGLCWPFLYSIKLGQVGPLLFLAFAAAWHWRDRPPGLGASMAAGSLVKVQPAILFGWALATRRWRAVVIGVAIAAALSAASALLLGIDTWFDYVELLRRVSTPVTTPHNFTPGAIVFQLGVPESTAGALQLVAMAAVVAVTVVAWFRIDDEASLAVTVVASQLLSPLLWDHYAMLLLIPTALLLERRHWWAIVIPLAGWLPPVAYPLMFTAGLLGPFLAARPGGRRAGPAASGGTASAGAAQAGSAPVGTTGA